LSPAWFDSKFGRRAALRHARLRLLGHAVFSARVSVGGAARWSLASVQTVRPNVIRPVDLRVMAARGAIRPTTRYLHENVQQWLGHLLKESCHIPLSIAMLFAPVRFTLHGEYASTQEARLRMAVSSVLSARLPAGAHLQKESEELSFHLCRNDRSRIGPLGALERSPRTHDGT
jgi:hypothetical protein